MQRAVGLFPITGHISTSSSSLSNYREVFHSQTPLTLHISPSHSTPCCYQRSICTYLSRLHLVHLHRSHSTFGRSHLSLADNGLAYAGVCLPRAGVSGALASWAFGMIRFPKIVFEDMGGFQISLNPPYYLVRYFAHRMDLIDGVE